MKKFSTVHWLLLIALPVAGCESKKVQRPPVAEIHQNETVEDMVRREFTKVIIPKLEFDHIVAWEAIEFVMHRANEESSDDPTKWMFGYTISRSTKSSETLMANESTSPGSSAPSPEPTITATFENVSAMTALEKVCKMCNYKFTVTDMGRFEILDMNDYPQ